MNRTFRAVAMLLGLLAPSAARSAPAQSTPPVPLAIGETFTLQSTVMGETRRINVYRAPLWGDSIATPRPVLYMPDGGIAEDFLHVAGLLQVSVGNGTMRPFLLVGIENTQRRRDMTGPTSDPEDRKIAPVVGGSAAFRSFIRTELMPEIDRRYPTTGETAIMGESLAGLFVVETLFLEPGMFDTYIAFDPSLWWNHNALGTAALPNLPAAGKRAVRLSMASSSEPTIARQAGEMARRLKAGLAGRLECGYEPMPEETHATIYHPAALRALRRLFAPAPDTTR